MDREEWFDHHAFFNDFMEFAARRGFGRYRDREMLRDWRKNIRALCAEVGISEDTFRNCARGMPVSLNTVCRMAWWADLPLDKYVIPGGRIVARR